MIPWLRSALGRLRATLGASRDDHEFASELRAHLALHTDENVRAGMTPTEARRRAGLALGGAAALHDQYQDRQRVRWLDDWGRDVRDAVRALWRAPGFTLTTVLTLAAGMSGTTLVFTLISAVLLRPLPVREPDQLVAISTAGDLTTLEQEPLTSGDYQDVSRDVPAFAAVVAHRRIPSVIGSGADGRVALGEEVSPNFFHALGVPLVVGRPFADDDDREAVVVLSHALWRQHFSRDARALGRTLEIGGRPRRVIGVAPEGFTGLFRGIAPEFWIPHAPGPDGEDRSMPRWWAHARLRTNAALGEARTAVAALGEALAARYPATNAGRRFRVDRLADTSVMPAVPNPLVTTGGLGALAAALLALVIAAVNVGHLILARGTSRQQESGIRIAIGASRWRVVRHHVTEALVLAAYATVLSLAVTYGVARALSTISLPLPVVVDLQLTPDWRVMVLAGVIAGVTALACAAGPAVRIARTATRGVAVQGSRRTTSRGGASTLLLTVQTAMAVLLLIVAGLAWRSLAEASRVDPGFETDRTLVASAAPGLAGFTPDRGDQFLASGAARVRALEGVTAAGWIQPVPLSLNVRITRVRWPGQNVTSARELPVVDTAVVWPGAFEALGVRLVSGRFFSDRDRVGSPSVAMVNDTFARRFGTGQSLIGQRIDVGFPEPAPVEIVGVVADFKYRTLGDTSRPMVFTAGSQDALGWQSATLVVSRDVSRRPPGPAAIARAVRGGDAAVPVFGAQPLLERMAGVLMLPRYAAGLFGALGLLALGLTAVGLFGTMWWWVQQRTRELGLRLALGERPASLIWLVSRQSLIPIGIGTCLGLAAAFGLTRALSALLYGVSPTDPVTMVGSAVVVVVSAGLATVWPAWRAGRVDPLAALRCE